jgi:hypothetical protein
MRLNLEISDEQMKSLKDLQEKVGAGTMKDYVNTALSVMEWAIRETAAGNEIAAVNEEKETFRVLVTPTLQNVARQSRVPEYA